MLRPVRTVHVTTKEELDAALATADQVTVEGDDELLSYAVNAAAGNPANRVAIETRPFVLSAPHASPASPSLIKTVIVGVALGAALVAVVGGGTWWFLSAPASPPTTTAASAPSLAPPPPQPVPAHPATVRSEKCAKIVARAQLGEPLSDADIAAIRTECGAEEQQRVPPSQDHPASPSEGQYGSRPSSPNPPGDFWTNFPSMLWPLVAVVAIVALFMIAWRAISSGSNVTIQWKVTEKVSGKVVITKVRERTPRQRAAA